MIHNQKGFSLVEAMIGTSLIVGLGMAGASYFKDQNKAQDLVNRHRQLQNFHNELTRTLQKTANCNATFRASSGATSVPTSDLTALSRCLDASGKCGDNLNASELDPSTDIESMFEEAETFPTSNKRWIDGTQTWQINSITTTTPINRSGLLDLQIVYQLYPGRPESKQVRKSIPLFVKFGSSGSGPLVFASCSSERAASVINLNKNLCDVLKGTATPPLTSPDFEYATWNAQTEKCELNVPPSGTIRGCQYFGSGPNGQYQQVMAGVNGTPSIACRNLTRDIDTKRLRNSTPADCSGGKRPALRLDSDRRLMVVCL